MMPDLLLYLLKVNGALLLFVAVYYGLLRRLTFHTLNRWYLLAAIAFSVLYPLLDVSALWPSLTEPGGPLPQWAPTWPGEMVVPRTPVPEVDYTGWVLALYWLGVAVLGLRLLVQGLSLWRLHRSTEPAGNLPFRQVTGEVMPFSFWQTIYLNPAQHTPAELPAILLHEQVHIRQWHTLDVLAAQLTRVFCWSNPAAWLLLRAVQENLEFIADQTVLETGQLDSKAYQYSLVRLSTLAPGPALVIPFTLLTLKNRIQMMNSQQSTSIQASRYLVVLGLAFGLLSFATPTTNPTAPKRREVGVQPGDTEKPAHISALPPAALAYIVQQYPGYRLIGVAELRAADGNNLRYKGEIAIGRRPVQVLFDATGKHLTAAVAEPLYFLDGKLIAKSELDKLDPNSIESMSVLKNGEALKSFGARATDGAVLIVTKKNKDSAAVQAFMKEHNITFKSASPEDQKLTAAVVEGRGLLMSDVRGRLLLVNGKEATAVETKIEVGRLQSVFIMDADKATVKYGEKGKNGAIIISTK